MSITAGEALAGVATAVAAAETFHATLAWPLQSGATAADAPPYAGLLFLATFVSLLGVFLTMHGAAAYALLVWEVTTGIAAWVYVHPAVGGFLIAAAAVQTPMAAHLWGDPLHVRRRTVWAIRAVATHLDER
ncbi:hypothetical protein [Halobaculum magnesiiphilum]|uniref:Uncharacterized protein n=1 Tax=Halobaculum magnesiiphilum TaxID=1017351 RepID=A0A8T8WCK4_9EURY|nr:hypothetical protein [Halobaculum magnesiiphilum]QZP37565.1 hypothetical protein K6T50_15025 [Halobaculum magnesiiphilum]